MKVTALAVPASGSGAKHQCVEGDNPENRITHVVCDPKEKSVPTRKPCAPHTQHNLEDPDSMVPPEILRNYLTV